MVKYFKRNEDSVALPFTFFSYSCFCELYFDLICFNINQGKAPLAKFPAWAKRAPRRGTQ